MKEEDKNEKTDLPGFHRYIKGEMTDRERNAFERELQRDPFAADAAEGFSEISAENAESDLTVLERQLKSRTSKRQRFVYYRIAASVAVLMIISSIFIIVQRNRDIAKEESGLIAKQVPMEIIQPQAITRPEVQKDEKVVITESRSEKAVKALEAVEAVKAVEGTKTIEAVIADEIPSEISEKKEEPVIVAENKALADDAEKVYPAAPVAGVAYGVEKKAVRKPEETDLDEVVVIGYGQPKEEVTGFSPALPAGGKRDFDKYVEENIRVPETLNEGEKAVVVVNFIVKTTGAIDSLKVIRSPGDEFSAEAKRLVIEGPQWSPATSDGKKVDDEVKLRIVFK
ncbi:MAG: energy transducer TonB [Bacteroidales bacterium]|jgi:hypothetical protein|nr:energy transducer TonB [Bacteroidales bacterium]